MPGRVNLIGEHIDYHNLPVLPMAIQRRIVLETSVRSDDLVRVESAGHGIRQVGLNEDVTQSPGGDWANYLKAAVLAVRTKWQVSRGFDGRLESNLPSAAGLSSSSALITACTLGLLRANGIEASLDELMSVLPDGEQFVGTRGGGMDHAAVLAGRAGCALLIRFAPFGVEQVQIPPEWCFVVAHSLTRAEKSGAANVHFNARRAAGMRAFSKSEGDLLSGEERDAFEHVTTEASRVEQAVAAMRDGDRVSFGQMLQQSHASLRDRLRVSSGGLDRIVEIAIEAGADGARLTGAGFGGCAIILCTKESRDGIVAALERDFYSEQAGYDRDEHVIFVAASDGALYATN